MKTKQHKGILIVVSGFSGAGKGTLMKRLVSDYDNYALSVSMTTRQPRTGEVDGREYFFSTKEEFEKKIEEEGLVEYACYCGNYYGTPRQYVFQQMADGRDVILEIEIQGALKIKERFPEALLLFVMPPSADELKHRLTSRGTETADVIAARLHRAAEEAVGINSYDYILVNDQIDTCVEEMHQLIQAQHNKVSNNLDFIEQMKEELKNL